MKIGFIDYLNLTPLRVELASLLSEDDELVYGHPSEINECLRRGDVLAAPCSSICLAPVGELALAAPLGVASYGAVGSVFLVAQTEAWFSNMARLHEQLVQEWASVSTTLGVMPAYTDTLNRRVLDTKLPRVAFSRASETSNALAEVLLTLWFGDYLPARSEAEADLIVRIGDLALTAARRDVLALDLGLVWHEWLGLPFVFATWQMHRDAQLGRLPELLLEATQRSRKRLEVDPHHYLSFVPTALHAALPSEVIVDYWQGIDYELEAEHMKALEYYLQMVQVLRVQRHQFPGQFPSKKTTRTLSAVDTR